MSVQGRRPAGDIEITVEQTDPLMGQFLNAPNALFRGEQDATLGLDFRGYTLRERALLAALLTMKSGFKCTRRRIDKLAPELGHDGLDTVLVGLRIKGNLRVTREHGEGGRFTYRWAVSLRSREDWIAAEKAEREARRRASLPGGVDVSAGRHHGWLSHPWSDPDNSDVTIPGSATHGSAMGGSATPHIRRPRSTRKPGEPEHPPLPPERPAPPPPVPDTQGRGSPPVEEDPTAVAVLDSLLGDTPTIRHPRGQGRARVLAGIFGAMVAGWTPAQLGEALAGRFDGAGSIGAVLAARIADLGPPSPPSPSAEPVPRPPRKSCTVPGCDSLTGGGGHIGLADDRVSPCPTCLPDSYARLMRPRTPVPA